MITYLGKIDVIFIKDWCLPRAKKPVSDLLPNSALWLQNWRLCSLPLCSMTHKGSQSLFSLHATSIFNYSPLFTCSFSEWHLLRVRAEMGWPSLEKVKKFWKVKNLWLIEHSLKKTRGLPDTAVRLLGRLWWKGAHFPVE